MFDNLTQRFTQTVRNLMGRGRLTENNVKETLREIRVALLEADVALPVVKTFLEKIQQQAMGTAVLQSLSPGQVFIKIVHDELIQVLGEAPAELNLRTTPPAVIVLVGLQGSGKTTTTAKLGVYLKNRLHKKVFLTSTDIYRPAALDQLKILSDQAQLPYYFPDVTMDPLTIIEQAMNQARTQFMDVVLIDTAGRLHLDAPMMEELKKIHEVLHPIETLFVMDSMLGQEAVQVAETFQQTLPLTGIILTKFDGDARGGAAFSVWERLHQPIKFVGVGEKLEALEPFYPDRMAQRLLGMGDIVSLVEEVQQKVDHEKAKKLTQKFTQGRFDLKDFLSQLEQMEQLGGMSALVSKLPGMHSLPPGVMNQMSNHSFKKMKAMIQSMTPQERRFPAIIKASRKIRITQGSGTQVQDLNQLLKQFSLMEKMMKQFSKKGAMRQILSQVKGLLG